MLCLAEEILFQDELRRNLLRYGVLKSGVDHRIEQMTEHFPDAMVTGYESLVAGMENQTKDRHVLAAAVRGRAELIVTENLRDFPRLSPRASTSMLLIRTSSCSISGILIQSRCVGR